MKRSLSRCLALLCLITILPVAATAEYIDETLVPAAPDDGYFFVTSLALGGGDAFFASVSGVYCYTQGGLVLYGAYPQDGFRPDLLFWYHDHLYGLQSEDGRMGAITPTQDGVLSVMDERTLDMTNVKIDVGDTPYTPLFTQPFVLGDTLYTVSETADFGVGRLNGWDITTGQKTVDTVMEHLYAAVGANEGQMLLILRNAQAYEANLGGNAAVMRYQPQTGSQMQFAESIDFLSGGFAYHGAEDALYYIADSTLWKTTPGQVKQEVGYASVSYLDASTPAGWWNGRYVIGADGTVMLRTINAQAAKAAVLRISSFYTPPAHAMAEAQINAAAMVVSPREYTASEVLERIQAGDDRVDLYVVSGSDDVAHLFQAGAIPALDGCAAVQRVTDALAAPYQALVTDQGVPHALIIALTPTGGASCLYASESVWKRNGLDMSQLPDSYEDYLRFIIDYCNALPQGAPNANVTNVYDKGAFLMEAVDAYLADCQKTGDAPDFTGAVFRTLMPLARSAVTALTNADMLYEYRRYGAEDEDEYWNRDELMWLGTPDFLYPTGELSEYVCHPLPLVSGGTPAYPVDVDMLLINPNTRHMEQALQYLDAYAENLDAALWTLLCPDAQPTDNPVAKRAASALPYTYIKRLSAFDFDTLYDQCELYASGGCELEAFLQCLTGE